MTPYAIVEATRPEVGPMPADARRHVRERLFDVAQTNQAPPPPARPPRPAGASVRARVGILAALVAAGFGAFVLTSTRNAPDELATAEPTTAPDTTIASEVVEVPPAPTTAAPTTTSPPAGSAEAPLLLPVGRVRLDDLDHTPRPNGQHALLLRAPDGSTIGLLETDGLPPEPPPTTVDGAEPDPDAPVVLPWERVGDVRARRIVGEDVDDRHYEVELPCGTLEIADGDRFALNRQEIRDLIANIDVRTGRIEIRLPTGWDVVSNGAYTGRFELGIPIEDNGGASTFRLVQYPASEIAFAAYGGTQLRPIDFLGEQAWLGQDLDDPRRLTVIGKFGDTAFSVQVTGLSVGQIENVLLRLELGTIDDWVDRFGALTPATGPDLRGCDRQPEFVVLR